MTESHTTDQPLPVSFWNRILTHLFHLGLLALFGGFLLSLFASQWWLAELFTHFRLQGFWLSLLLLVTAFALRRRYIMIPIGMLFLLHLVWLWPYLSFSTEPSKDEAGHSLLAWNVYVGNRQTEEVIDLIRKLKPESVLLLEVNFELERALQQLGDLYSVMKIESSGDAFGIAFLSRNPDATIEIVEIGTGNPSSIVAALGEGVTFVGAHTLPPRSANYATTRNSHLQALAERIAASENPIILAGDLNVTPWSPYFRKLIESSKLNDTRLGRGIMTSWPSNRFLIQIPIDHILVSEKIEVLELEVLSDSAGSDHFPLLLRWRGN